MSENKLEFLDFKEHVIKRSTTWLGSNTLSDENSYWIIDTETKNFIKKPLNITDSLSKIFDELLVNAQDQYIRSPTFKKENGGPVTYIDVKFIDNEIQITNDGQGIEIYFNEKIKNYSVEGIITREYSGSNFDDNSDRVTGGLNGVGLKLCVTLSKKFTIETVDWNRKLYYKQICKDNMNIIEKPIIIDLTNSKNNKYYNPTEYKKLNSMQKTSHTTVSIIPDYAKLCRKFSNEENPNWINENNLNDFKQFIETRLYQTAAFISCIEYRYKDNKKLIYDRRSKVYFNDEEIKVKNLTEFAKLFGLDNVIEFKMSGTVKIKKSSKQDEEEIEIPFPWYVCIGCANNLDNSKKELAGLGMSIINGVFLSKGGSHINLLYNQIKSSLKDNIDSLIKDTNIEFKDSMLKKTLFIIDVKQIPVPQFEGGNVKNSITISGKDLNLMKKMYIIPDKIITKIWKMIKDIITYQIQKQDLTKSNKKKKMTKIRKYNKADKLGTKSGLFIPEGDSAAKPIRDILTSKKSPIGKSNHGMYNIQGVPPNALKKVKEIMIDGKNEIIQDKDLQNNIALQGLAAVLNLNYNYTYYYGSSDTLESDDPEEIKKRKQGDKEFTTLNYGYIIIATDQDLDGIGNICSLIIVYILLFFPELVKRGFIRRLQTPLVRVYMPGKNCTVKQFYSMNKFKQWVINEYGSEDNMPELVKKGVQYYKGLGTHTTEEVINMGEHIHDNIIQLTWNEVVDVKMRLFYGQDTGDRKEVLLTPVTAEYTDQMLSSLEVPISSHFEIESKSFQLYFMLRKLKNAYDGMIPSQRKAFAGARIMFRKESKAKVYQLTGYVTKKMHYQHGDSSMNETIIKMAQNFTGSNNIPMFTAISDGFGDRVNGRGESASPRYINMKYNSKVMDLIYPPIDDWLLQYVYEDGEQAEPVYYVPIIPYSILETTTTTGVGWKIDVWARDYDYTISILYSMIEHDYPNKKINNPYYSNKKTKNSDSESESSESNESCSESEKSEDMNDNKSEVNQNEEKEEKEVILGKPYGFLNKVWIRNDMKIITGKSKSGKRVSEMCLGKYYVDKDKETVTITQLPLKIWSYPFSCALLGIHPKTGKTENKEGVPYHFKEYVDDVMDNTGNDQNEIIIKLKPGSLKLIMENYGTNSLDPIEHYFGIYQILTPQLNMIGGENSVKEFKSYEDVMSYWFIERKSMYIKRLERQRILLELEILFKSEILRFIDMDKNKIINIDEKTDSERDIILSEDGKFVKFNKTNLLTPKYIKTEELRDYILKYGASYKYIDAITKGDTKKEEIEKQKIKLQNMKDELDKLNKVTWKEIWLRELSELDKVIKDGIRTKWLFSDKKHIFENSSKLKSKTNKPIKNESIKLKAKKNDAKN